MAFFPLNFIEFLNCFSVIFNGILKGLKAVKIFKVFKYKNQEIISNSQESHLLESEQEYSIIQWFYAGSLFSPPTAEAFL